MTIWDILEIEETKDKKAITRAYRTKLKRVNPEDAPEEFKQLRAAYEEALEYAKKEDHEEEKEQTPLDRWVGDLDRLYNDFRRRIDLYAWRELLGQEIAMALDSRASVEEALLVYLMGHNRIPQRIWQFLNEQFSWTERVDELMEKFPPQYIHNIVLNGVRFREILPYDMFFPDEDAAVIEKYIDLYIEAINTPLNEANDLIQEMIDLPEDHPYGQALVYCWMIDSGDVEKGIAELEQLNEDYAEDDNLMRKLADAYVNVGMYEKGEALCRHIMDTSKDTYLAKWLLAHCLAGQQHYVDAVDLIGELMAESGGDMKRLTILNDLRKEWNEEQIKVYEKTLEENPDDLDARFMLAWCFHQNERNEEAFELAMTLKPEEPDPFGYYNLLNSLYFERKDYEKALDCIDHLIPIVETMKPDGTHKTQRRIERLGEMYTRRGECYFELKQIEKGFADYEKAFALEPDSGEIHDLLIRAYFRYKNYDRAAELARSFTARHPELYHGYILLGLVLFEQHEDREALDAINTAIELDPADLAEYILKARIFIRNNVPEEAQRVISFMCDSGLSDDVNVRWCQLLLDQEQKTSDVKTLLDGYTELEAQIHEGLMQEHWAADFYYQFAMVTARVQDETKAYDRSVIYDLLEKGLEADPDSFDCLDYKGWLLKKDRKYEESLEIYHRLEKRRRYNLYVEQMLAELYYATLEQTADKALWYYEKLLQEEDSPVNRFYAGMCCLKMGNYEKAIEHFHRERELDPEDIDSYHRLTQVYLGMGRLDEALAEARTTVEMARKRKDNPYRFFLDYIRVLRRLNRPMEAVEVAREISENYEFPNGNRLIFDIYAQFGMWEEAKAHLNRWVRRTGDGGVYAARAMMHMYRNDTGKAESYLKKNMELIDEDQYQELLARLYFLKGEADKAIPYYLSKAEQAPKDQPDVFAMNRIAEAYALSGDMENARRMASLALTALDPLLEEFDGQRTLYYSRTALLLAILGKYDEARRVVANSRTMPLCSHCSCGRCKDADLYECYVELFSGNKAEALRLAKNGQVNWPDEEDFQTLEVYAERMGK